jgi:hypothetical protein
MVISGKKGPRKSSKKSTKKSASKTAKVQLDPATVLQFEQQLRAGLVASGAVMASTESPKLQTVKGGANVELDSDAIASLNEILRNGLVASGAVMESELPILEPAAPAGGGSKPRAKSKKRYSSGSKKR